MMAKAHFTPYRNESDCLQLADLTIENRLDRVSVYGSIDLTKDKTGLENARDLKRILDQVVAVLEASDLPDMVSIEEPETVKNPFA
jgi:hypothetical protein